MTVTTRNQNKRKCSDIEDESCHLHDKKLKSSSAATSFSPVSLPPPTFLPAIATSSTDAPPTRRSTRFIPAQIVRSRSENWEYVNSILSTLDEKEAIPWDVIYVNGRRNGYFSTFGNSPFLRATYSRWKKKLI